LRHWDGNPAALGYLVEGVNELGVMLPDGVRRALVGVVRNPARLRARRRRAPVRRIRMDEEDRIHVEE
jgi:hypothetical protein